MSVAAVDWVLKHAPSHSAPARAVALVLAWHHSPEQGAFPKRETIVAETRLGDGTVGRALRALEAEGTIRRDGCRPGGGTIVWRFVAIEGPATLAEPEPAEKSVRPERPDRPERLPGSASVAGSVRPEWPTIGQGETTDRSERPGGSDGPQSPGKLDLDTSLWDQRRAHDQREDHEGDDNGVNYDETPAAIRAAIRASLPPLATGIERGAA